MFLSLVSSSLYRSKRWNSRGNYSTGFNVPRVFGEYQRRPDLWDTWWPDLNLFDCSVPPFPFRFFFPFSFCLLSLDSSLNQHQISPPFRQSRFLGPFFFFSPFLFPPVIGIRPQPTRSPSLPFVRVLFAHLASRFSPLLPAASILHDPSKTSLYQPPIQRSTDSCFALLISVHAREVYETIFVVLGIKPKLRSFSLHSARCTYVYLYMRVGKLIISFSSCAKKQ